MRIWLTCDCVFSSKEKSSMAGIYDGIVEVVTAHTTVTIQYLRWSSAIYS